MTYEQIDLLLQYIELRLINEKERSPHAWDGQQLRLKALRARLDATVETT